MEEDKEEKSKWEWVGIVAPAPPSCAAPILNHCSTGRDCLAFDLENRDLLPKRGLLVQRVRISAYLCEGVVGGCSSLLWR